MVDPVSGTGSIQSIQSINRAQDARREGAKSSETSRTEPLDEVRISQAAQDTLNTAQAESTAKETRTILEQQQQEALGLDPNFDRSEES